MTKRGKLKTYDVYYSGHSKAKIKAYSATGAKKQAWRMLRGFKCGWSKRDFMRAATVTRIS